MGSTAVVFVAVSWVHLRGIFDSAGGLSDKYFYFDTCADPAYIAMWRNDRPFGAGDVWPPLGELGGVGLFTVLLAAGAAVALALGWRRTVVIAIGFSIFGAWVIRMWLASQMYATDTVRLYPRTTMVVLYGLLLLTGLAIYFTVDGIRRQLSRRDFRGVTARQIAPTALLLIPLLFLFASAGSATIDRYMPNKRVDGNGYFAWIAQTTKTADGSCSPYADDQCGASPTGDNSVQCGPGMPPRTTVRSLGRPEQEADTTVGVPATSY
jgi:galactan 5-O-arabinofuranosyltransferase